MTAVEYRQKYPTMNDRDISMLVEIDEKEVLNAKLCRIDDPDCESCQ